MPAHNHASLASLVIVRPNASQSTYSHFQDYFRIRARLLLSLCHLFVLARYPVHYMYPGPLHEHIYEHMLSMLLGDHATQAA